MCVQRRQKRALQLPGASHRQLWAIQCCSGNWACVLWRKTNVPSYWAISQSCLSFLLPSLPSLAGPYSVDGTCPALGSPSAGIIEMGHWDYLSQMFLIHGWWNQQVLREDYIWKTQVIPVEWPYHLPTGGHFSACSILSPTCLHFRSCGFKTPFSS